MPALLDPGNPSPTDPARGRPTRNPSRGTGNGAARPFEVLDRSFQLLVCEPAPLALDGGAVGGGLPARPIPLDQLRSLLLHPSVGFDTRDAAHHCASAASAR